MMDSPLFDDVSEYTDSADAESSHVKSFEIVQHQLRDLVLHQQTAYDRLIEDSIIQCNTVKERTVSRVEFTKILNELEEERLSHFRTKARLAEVEDENQYLLCEMEILHGQLGREKDQFVKAFDRLQETSQKQSRERSKLASQCTNLKKTAHAQQSSLSIKEEQLKEMDRKLKLQKEQYEKKMIDLNLEKQQEVYANKVIQDMENKKPRRTILKAKN